MAVRVIKAGMLTTVQDAGRWGFQSRGVPVAGPMDPFSHRLANALVGSRRDQATLEVTIVGPALEFEDERLVAVAGAEFELTVDGSPIDSRQAFRVPAGSTLQFGARRRGVRAYVAIAGGITTTAIFGSRATHLTSAMGGLEGRAVRAGDRLPLGTVSDTSSRRSERSGRPPGSPELADGHASLRVLPGPQEDRFAGDVLDALRSAPYHIASSSDRMGYRLEGPRLIHARSADIISDATPLGALQVPASQQPILLMADRQTSGGYPKIATVISADISIAGQLSPGDTVSFEVCSTKEALAALIAQERALMSIEAG